MALAIVRRLFGEDNLFVPDLDFPAASAKILNQEELKEFKDVLDRYSKGDAHTRLNLWLFHRDLRAAFEVLEQHF